MDASGREWLENRVSVSLVGVAMTLSENQLYESTLVYIYATSICSSQEGRFVFELPSYTAIAHVMSGPFSSDVFAWRSSPSAGEHVFVRNRRRSAIPLFEEDC